MLAKRTDKFFINFWLERYEQGKMRQLTLVVIRNNNLKVSLFQDPIARILCIFRIASLIVEVLLE